jgi:hypothetical protein
MVAVLCAMSIGLGGVESSRPAEAYNTIAGYTGFRRVVTFTPNAGGNANLTVVALRRTTAASRWVRCADHRRGRQDGQA